MARISTRALSARARAVRQRIDALSGREDLDGLAADPGAAAQQQAEALEELDDHPVPPTVRAAAEWAWRLLVIGAAVYFAVRYLWAVRVVVFPIAVALLLAAALHVPVTRLRRLGLGRGAAAGVVLVTFLVVVLGGLSVVGGQLGTGVDDVADSAGDGIDKIRDWLVNGPFNVRETQIDRWIEQAQQLLSDNTDRLTSGAVGAAAAAVEVIAGALLALFTLFFFLYDGERIWAWIVRLFPRRTEPRVREAGRLAWRALEGYVRGTLFVALVDGVFITILLLVLRVPLAVPLGVIVFFGAFIPVVGAFLSGIIAVLVALVTQGPIVALVVLGGIIVIQQVEGHVLQPLVMGRLVRIHPLAIVLAIAFGSLVAGIIGAVVAVPIAAVVNVVTSYLVRGDVRPGGVVPPSPAAVPAPAATGPPAPPAGPGAPAAPAATAAPVAPSAAPETRP